MATGQVQTNTGLKLIRENDTVDVADINSVIRTVDANRAMIVTNQSLLQSGTINMQLVRGQGLYNVSLPKSFKGRFFRVFLSARTDGPVESLSWMQHESPDRFVIHARRPAGYKGLTVDWLAVAI